MTVMKVQVAMDIGAGMQVMTSFEHIVNDPDEAQRLGEEDKGLLDAYMEGYGRAD